MSLKIEGLNIKVGNEVKIIDSKFSIQDGNVYLLSGENGCGKSTLIKHLLDVPCEDQYFTGTSKMSVNDKYIVTAKDKEKFIRQVCYVPQSDSFEADTLLDCCLTSLEFINNDINKIDEIFDFVLKFKFHQKNFPIKNNAWTKHKAARLIGRTSLIGKVDYKELAEVAMFLLINPEKLSGGQKKIANIISCCVRYKYCNLLMFDEPLNALDYKTVREFSNFITQIHEEAPQLSILIVSHCRAILAINKLIEIKNKTIEESDFLGCNSCFGINENKYYI